MLSWYKMWIKKFSTSSRVDALSATERERELMCAPALSHLFTRDSSVSSRNKDFSALLGDRHECDWQRAHAEQKTRQTDAIGANFPGENARVNVCVCARVYECECLSMISCKWAWEQPNCVMVCYCARLRFVRSLSDKQKKYCVCAFAMCKAQRTIHTTRECFRFRCNNVFFFPIFLEASSLECSTIKFRWLINTNEYGSDIHAPNSCLHTLTHSVHSL